MIGELAALFTAFIWSLSSLFFTAGGREIGALNVNRIRLVFGVILLGLALFITQGWIWPPNVSNDEIFYLAISGVIGLVIGDSFLFSAMVMLGTRVTMLIFSLSPAIAAITAWLVMDETLDLLSIVGMVITLAGVIWVTIEKPNSKKITKVNITAKGVIFAFLGGAGQAVGIVFAKKGLEAGLDPMAGTFIRMLASTIAIWIIAILTGKLISTIKCFKKPRGIMYAWGGAVTGPFLGVWMSLVAVKHTEAGVAMAIMSIVPVLVIPWVIIFFKEKVSLRAVLGAVLAVCGVFILFLH